MKIEKDTQVHLLESLKSSSAKAKNESVNATTQAAAVSTQDKVELSGMKDEVNRIKEKVKAVPEVRTEKVAEMQQALKNETYNPKGELVARKILQTHLLDEII
jgi:flagellar biosynthesis anti-sigma factor FlgM